MNCRDIEPLLDAYFDGEVDLVKNLELQKHTETCALCGSRLKSLQSLRTSLKSAAPYYPAPDALRQWVHKKGASESVRSAPSLWNWQAWAPAGAFALFFAALYVGSPMVSRKTAEHHLSDEVVSAHVRSLMAAHLTDVASSNQHTVKPWFNGKLDFAPAVKDFAGYSFPLVGGRMDYLAERPVAALVYQRNQHYINFYEWPSPPDSDRSTVAMTHRGYNLIHWSMGGMTYWVVSDLNQKELQQFVQIVQTQELLPQESDR